MDAVRLAAIATEIVGGATSVIALVALIARRRDLAARLLSLGFVYLGLSIVASGSLIFLVVVVGEGRLPIVAAIVPFLLVGATAVRLRLAASRAFAAARKAQHERHSRTPSDPVKGSPSPPSAALDRLRCFRR